MNNRHFSNRTFQLWHYTVSHGTLLIRSPKNPENSLNIDLLFTGVEYVDAPRFLFHLAVSEVDQTEADQVAARIGRASGQRLWRLTTTQGDFHVLAASIKISEHDSDIFELQEVF